MSETSKLAPEKKTLETSLQKLLAGLSRSGQESSLTREIADLYGQIYLLTIVVSILKAMLNAALFWGFGILLYWYFPPPECVQACFFSATQGCCALHGQLLLRAACLLLLFFAGSFVGSLFVRTRTLQHSVTVTALMIISSILFLLDSDLPSLLTAVFEVMLFFSMYYGYRLSLRYRLVWRDKT